MKRIDLSVIILVIGLFVSCSKSNTSSNLYIPNAGDVTANATLSELQQGRELYINNCGTCHVLYSPDDFTPNNWKSIIPNMYPRTVMNSSQALLVTKYVCRGKQ
jgi:mono/diheme cytochrome c family protein